MMRPSSRRKILFAVLTITIVVVVRRHIGLKDVSYFNDEGIENRSFKIQKQQAVLLNKTKMVMNARIPQQVEHREKDLGEAMYAVRIVRPRHQNNESLVESVEAELLIPNKPANSKSLYSDKDMVPEKLTCQLYENSYTVKNIKVIAGMTLSICHSFCLSTNSTFMALANGDSCICSDQHGESCILKEHECNTPCGGDETTLCGGDKKAMFYRIASLDGWEHWSMWSRYSISKPQDIWTRYRGCPLMSHNATVCTAQVQRDFYHVSDDSILKHFIGCFTSGSFEDLSSPFIKLVMGLTSVSLAGYSRCLESCQLSSASFYAVITRHKCLCTISLGWSQTTEACTYGVGALVYSVKPLIGSSTILRFEGRKTEKNVAVLAHYRGGSTLASAMFSVRKGSLSAFELDKLLGSKWPGVSIMGREEERSHIYLTKILPAWFNCDSFNLPGVFYKVFPNDVEFYFGFGTIMTCLYAAKHKKVPTICGPFIREKCLMSPIVSAKSVRILHAGAISNALTQYPHIQFVHTLRDPRAMHASRASMNSYYVEDVAQRIKDSCWELVELYKSLETGSPPANIHIIHYEDMASDLLSTAEHVYRSMDMTLTQDINSTLLKMMGVGAERLSEFDIVQENPKARINSWMAHTARYTAIEEADESDECSALYRYYKSYYKPLKSLLEEDAP